MTVPDGHLQAGMTVCVETYIGTASDNQGVKPEDHLLVTENGPEVLSEFSFEEKLLSRQV